MLIDTHCHIDQFPSPEEIVRECEMSKIRVVAVTNLPSHFAIAADRLSGNKYVCPALGMHPLFSSKGIRELGAFRRMALKADFIGEIGLDFSPQGAATKAVQERVFEEVLTVVQDRPRFLTLHSRRAEEAVLEGLRRHSISGAVFHWFSGPRLVLNNLLADGHFVSVNPAMLSSQSGQQVISLAPKANVLVESDGPFTKVMGQTCRPASVSAVYQALCSHWSVSFEEAVDVVRINFQRITDRIRCVNGSDARQG